MVLNNSVERMVASDRRLQVRVRWAAAIAYFFRSPPFLGYEHVER
jgi:hypothetical protein